MLWVLLQILNRNFKKPKSEWKVNKTGGKVTKRWIKAGLKVNQKQTNNICISCNLKLNQKYHLVRLLSMNTNAFRFVSSTDFKSTYWNLWFPSTKPSLFVILRMFFWCNHEWSLTRWCFGSCYKLILISILLQSKILPPLLAKMARKEMFTLNIKIEFDNWQWYYSYNLSWLCSFPY